MTGAPRVVIVAEHASYRFGGEAALPLHWFRCLRRRGVEAWLVVHARTRDELLALLPEEEDRIRFVPDTRWHRWLWRIGSLLPARIDAATTGVLSNLVTQFQARQVVRRLIAEHAVDVVHEPIRVSPRNPSLMHGLGVPVVMGPLNGAMTFPPAFAGRQGLAERLVIRAGRILSDAVHLAIPGKRLATTILVANPRTQAGLPRGVQGRIVEMIENGIDARVWFPRRGESGDVVRFVFSGRLVDWKAVDLLLRAFALATRETDDARLDIVGDGPERAALEGLAHELGIDSRVRFLGFLPQSAAAAHIQEADVLVLPSLFECGGAVVLEALACGVAVIATRWGGPADYVDESCGILVDPAGPEAFVSGLARAIQALAEDPQRRRRLGAAGPKRIAALGVEWEAKTDRILEVYAEAIGRFATGAR